MPELRLSRPAAQRWLLCVAWGLLLMLAIWRLVLALMVHRHGDAGGALPAMQGAIVIRWRELDAFAIWAAVLALLLGRDLLPARLGAARAGRVVGMMALAGMLLQAAATWLGQVLSAAGGLVDVLAYLALALFAVVSLVTALREARSAFTQLRTPGEEEPPGLTILDLWRFAAAQWGLLMAVAVVFVSLGKSRDARLESEGVRNLLFLLPMAGVLPNAMMAAGIAWWDRLAPLAPPTAAGTRPRVRAWVVALLLVNLGAVLVVMPRTFPGIPGALLMMVGTGLYLAGFPAAFWRAAGLPMLLAWGLLLLALAGLLAERTWMLAHAGVSTFYSGAWRHLWLAGAVPAWGIAFGMTALRAAGSSARPRRVFLLAFGALLAGVAGATLIWLLTASREGTQQVPIMKWLALEAGLELLGIALAGAGMFLARPCWRKPPA